MIGHSTRRAASSDATCSRTHGAPSCVSAAAATACDARLACVGSVSCSFSISDSARHAAQRN
eukprot:7381650-Prymnesium_polylepis.2